MATTVDTSNLSNLFKKFENITDEQKKQKLSEWGKKGYQAGRAARSAGRANAAQQRHIQKWINASIAMAVTNLAQQVQWDIKYRFLSAIDRFYADYDPSSYERTGSLEKAYNPVLRKEGNSYIFGAEIDANRITPNPYHSIYKPYPPSDLVKTFENFYIYGRHGYNINLGNGNKWIAPRSSPPRDRLHAWWNTYRVNAYKDFNIHLKQALEKNKRLLKG